MGAITRAPINFTASEDQSASELGGAAPLVVNAVADDARVVRRRPGISAWSPFDSSYASGSPVIGMVPYGPSRLVYVTEDRKIHSITTAGALTELSSDDTDTMLDGGGRPSMVAGRSMLAMAGGGFIQKWTGAGLSERLQNTSSSFDPPLAVSIGAIARRLVAQIVGNSGEIWWSGPLDAWENWDMTSTGGSSFISSAAKPDPLVYMRENTNEVFCFGPETTQVFAPSALQVDANDPNNLLDFAPVRTQAIGTVSPYGIVQLDDMFGMPDRHKRIIITDARTFKDISKQVATVLAGLSRIDDAWGFRMRFDRFDTIVWIFPTDNVGLIWDANTGNWSEWRQGDEGDDDIGITSAYHWPEENVFLVGMSDGSIAQLDANSNADLDEPIRVEIKSGFSTRGTTSMKACRRVTFQFRRTWEELEADSSGLSPSGHVRISYRDKQGAWKILKDIELSTDSDPCVVIPSVGVYRTRQWRIQYTGEDELQLVSADEELEILEAA
jgi:hypothetical protein